MNRILIAAVLAALTTNAAALNAQSWMFQPGTYSKTYGPQAPAATPQVHAYATFTESQAAQAAKLPKPAFQWDSTGILGRGRKYDMWRHQEAMQATQLRTYAQGVRDTVGAPIWTWNGQTPRPTPQIVAPTATSPGRTRLPAGP